LQFFTKVQQRSTLQVLQTYPTPQEAMAASGEQIVEVLKTAGHPTPEKTATKIVEQLNQPHLTADEVTTRTKARLMLVLIRQLPPMIEEIAA